MLTDILLLAVGLALVIFGADWLVDGASSIARKLGVGEFVIGLTIVGFGTSCPELVVSLTGALQGNADISIGNVVGSNAFNTLLILGLTALITPVTMTRANARRDIPVTLLVTFLFVIFGLQGQAITRIEGIIFLLLFVAYIWFSFKTDKSSLDAAPAGDEKKEKKLWLAIVLVIAGLAGLVVGGQMFVDNATSLAKALGVSDKIIAITLLAGGTSLPELATCVVAAAKHKDALALGNILGSNVFNILLILGASAVVTPLSTAAMNLADFGVVLFSAVLLWIFTYTGKRNKIDRWEGAILLACEICYMVYLFIKG